MANNGAVGALFATLGLDTAQFSEGIANAQKAGSGFASAFASVGKSVALAGAAMAASAGTAFVTFGAQALKSADDIGDAAARIGISAVSFQKLGAAASAAGGTPELMTAALDKLNVGLGQFQANGNGPAAEAFKQLGLSSKIASGEIANSEQAFYAIAGAMEGVKNPAEKAAMATKLFGRAAGPDMLEVLGAGEQGLRQYGDAAQNTGRIMSEEMIKKLPEMKKNLDEAKRSLSQIATVFAGQALLGMEGFFNSLQPTIQSIRGLAVQVGNFLQPSLQELSKAFSSLAANESFITYLKLVGTVVGGTLVVGFRLAIQVVTALANAIDWTFKKIAPMIAAIDKHMKQVVTSFAPATQAMQTFSNTAKKMENDVTKNSYVPDMVDEIVRQMERSDKAFNSSTSVMQRYAENAKLIAADLREFEGMSQADRAAGAIARADARAARPDFLGNVGAIKTTTPTQMTSTDWIEKWKEGQVKAINDNNELRAAFASTFSDGLSEALNGNGGNWMKTWWQKTMQNVFQNAMSNVGAGIFDMLKGVGGGAKSGGGGFGGILKTALSFFTKAPGFATGGSGVVGGSGGPDSQFIGMRLSPGELVNVSKPGNDNGGMGGQIIIPVSLGGKEIETIMVDIATRQASLVTSSALQGVSSAQARQRAYSRFG